MRCSCFWFHFNFLQVPLLQQKSLISLFYNNYYYLWYYCTHIWLILHKKKGKTPSLNNSCIRLSCLLLRQLFFWKDMQFWSKTSTNGKSIIFPEWCIPIIKYFGFLKWASSFLIKFSDFQPQDLVMFCLHDKWIPNTKHLLYVEEMCHPLCFPSTKKSQQKKTEMKWKPPYEFV